jgi:putative oxidoreductase
VTTNQEVIVMSSPAATVGPTWSLQDLRNTRPGRAPTLARAVAGLPLLAIGSAHVFVADAPMRPLVEAAGLPFPSLLAPLGVAAEIIAGLSLVFGLWARVGGVLAIPTMLAAIYAHLVIDVWPNGAANEPPLVLPIAVAVAATYVIIAGAGRWSLDHRHTTTNRGTRPEL